MFPMYTLCSLYVLINRRQAATKTLKKLCTITIESQTFKINLIIPNRECVIRLAFFIVNCVTLCNVLRIMHCVSLAILSQLIRFHPPAVGTN